MLMGLTAHAQVLGCAQYISQTWIPTKSHTLVFLSTVIQDGSSRGHSGIPFIWLTSGTRLIVSRVLVEQSPRTLLRSCPLVLGKLEKYAHPFVT